MERRITMWKKILLGIFISASILSLSGISHANNGAEAVKTLEQVKIEQNVDVNRYKLIRPEKKLYTIEEKIDFINGIAPAETTITIEIYGTTDLTRKNFNLLKLPSKEDYIEVFTEEIIVGNTGIFSRQLDLVTGINKIIINFGVEGLEPEEIIIFVNPNNREIRRPEKLIDIIIKN